MTYTIDRIEGDYAVCIDDNGNRIEIKKNLLPDGAGEGLFISMGENGGIALLEDTVREKRIADKMKAVWR
jgi:hypothetical protein